MDDILFTSSITPICKDDIRIGIWIKQEFETEKVKHYLVDISIEKKDMLTVIENACIGLNSELIDTAGEDAANYRSKVFDILTSNKLKKYLENNGYFNNIAYVDGGIIKEHYESMDKILKEIRKEYPLNVRTKRMVTDDDRCETIRLQFEDSNNESVEQTVKGNN